MRWWLRILVFQLAGFFDKSYWYVTLTRKGKTHHWFEAMYVSQKRLT